MKKIILMSVFSLAFFGIFSLNVSKAQASTLYFNGAVDSDWNTLGNWWNDSGFTSAASTLPTPTDDVIVSKNVNTNTGTSASVNTLTVNDPASLSISIAASNGITFYGTAVNHGNITGNVTFNDSSGNSYGGSIIGDATFTYVTGNTMTISNSDQWIGTISGSIKNVNGQPITNWIFNDSSSSYYGSTFTGNAIFNGSSINNGIVTGNAIFNDQSFNHSIVTGDATFNNSSNNQYGTVNGNAIFNDSSSNESSAKVSGNAIFNGSSSNQSSTVAGSAIFNDSSTNKNGGTITGDAIFNNSSNNDGGIVINATFNDSSSNKSGGTISGKATFNNSSNNNGGNINGGATFNDSSYNKFDYINGNVTFNDSSYTQDDDINGNAIFNDSSINEVGSTILLDACFATTATNNGVVNGTISVCPILIPTVSTTSSSTNIDSSSATLGGAIIATGGAKATEVGFEYGLDTTYGSSQSISGTFTHQAFSVPISSLACASTYHFRAFATNTAGTGYGTDATFKTTDCSVPVGGGTTTPITPPQPTISHTSGGSYICRPGDKFNIHTGLPCPLEIVNSLPSQAVNPSTSSTNSEPAKVCSITTTLKLGSKGTEVKCLQINLNLKVDGAFGKATKIALLAWQKKEGLTADGVFGNKSREVWGKQD